MRPQRTLDGAACPHLALAEALDEAALARLGVAHRDDLDAHGRRQLRLRAGARALSRRSRHHTRTHKTAERVGSGMDRAAFLELVASVPVHCWIESALVLFILYVLGCKRAYNPLKR
jgi:hypothetical protein